MKRYCDEVELIKKTLAETYENENFNNISFFNFIVSSMIFSNYKQGNRSVL